MKSANDMTKVIAQFEHGKKPALRPVGNKPVPSDSKPTLNEPGTDFRALRKSVTDKVDNSQPADDAHPFKVALKPVVRPTGAGIAKSPPGTLTKAVKPTTDQTPDTSLVSSKSKMFEGSQRQSVTDTPTTPFSTFVGVGTKPKPVNHKPGAAQTPETSVSSKSKMFEASQNKAESETPTAPTVGGVGAKLKTVKPGTAQTPETSSVSSKSKLFEASQNKAEAETPTSPCSTFKPKPLSTFATLPKSTGATKTQEKDALSVEKTSKFGNANVSPSFGKKIDITATENRPKSETDKEPECKKDDNRGPTKRALNSFANELENKASNAHPFGAVKPGPKSSGSTNTLPKPSNTATSNTASKATKATEEIGRLKATNEINKLKLTPTPSEKSDRLNLQRGSTSSKKDEETTTPPLVSEEPPQPSIPARKAQNKIEEKLNNTNKQEDNDQPKIPPRKDQSKQDEKTVQKQPAKQSATGNQVQNEAKQNKAKESSLDHNANKVAPPSNFQSLLRNKDRPLPKPAPPKYKLLPKPKKSGKAPKKLAKPPGVDLSKFMPNSTPKTTTPPVEAYEDDDELYEDCDNIPVSRNSNRISEYTEEEEAKMEKIGREKGNNTTDNYGKMISNEEEIYEDDDEIYQEID